MPRLSPRRIRITAITVIPYGMIRRNVCRTGSVSLAPSKPNAIIAGKVPAPNIAINSVLCSTDPVVKAPAMATYTIPQGNKPFAIPSNTKEGAEAEDLRSEPINR